MVKNNTSNSGLSDIIRDLTKKEREALISILNDKEEDGENSSRESDGEIDNNSNDSGSGVALSLIHI